MHPSFSCHSCHGWRALCAVLAILFLAEQAPAYVGPTPDPSFIGYFVSLLGFLAVAGSALLLWPIHTLRRWLRGTPEMPKQEFESVPAASTDGPAEPGA